MKKPYNTFLLITLFIIVFTISVSAQFVRVNSEFADIRVRILPETESIMVGKAFKGDIFKYISEENDWIGIEMFSGDARYIHRSLVETFTQSISAPFSNEICLKLMERLEEAKKRSLTESDVKFQNVLFDRYVLDIFHEYGLQPVVFKIAVNRCSEGLESKIGQRPSEMKADYTLGAPIEKIELKKEVILESKPKITETQNKGNSYDFRNTYWGMSKEQVKATESIKPASEEENHLAYYVKINGKDYICVYSFIENKLYNAGYFFDGKHTNRNEYISDYEDLKEIIIDKYGKPKTDRTTWDNDLYKDDRSKWGFAVSLGHLSYGATWDTSTTYITLRLFGDNYDISLIVAYDSRELWEKADKYKEEKTKTNF